MNIPSLVGYHVYLVHLVLHVLTKKQFKPVPWDNIPESARSLVPTVLLEVIVPLVPILSHVPSVIDVRLVHSFPNHVTLVNIIPLLNKLLVRNALRGTTVRLQLDGIQRQTIDSNALGDISA